MTTPRLWLSLVFAAAAVATPACGGSTRALGPDGGAGSSAAGSSASGSGGGGGSAGTTVPNGSCSGEPIGCVQGAPLGTGVACGGLVTPASCFEGHWECGNLIPQTSCTCGEPGVACAGALCTPNGWVCPDGGVDADAGHDAPADGAGCGDAANPYCGQSVGGPGPLVICSDYFKAATCVAGQWTCEADWIPSSSCTCSLSAPPGCNVCTPHGWTCPDGGVDGASGG